MTKLYKLTDENSQTYAGCQWGEHVTHTASGQGDLCTDAWLHAYTHPVLALLLNPIHAKFSYPQLWECVGMVRKTDNGLKVGCTRLTTLHQIPVPNITSVNRIAFAIGCAYNAYAEPPWVTWARGWVLNTNRAADAAAAAYSAVHAAYSAAYSAAAAAYSAAYAAYATHDAAYAADAAYSAAYAAYADDAAAAAYSAAYAAAVARLPLHALATWAMQIS